MSIYGIDLGTTYSCIARLHEGKPEVLPVDGLTGLVPSAVGLENGIIIVGQRALNRAVGFSESTVLAVKSRMGSQEHLVLQEGATTQKMLPQEISAAILQYLAQSATEITGEPVRDVVITVPAYFSEAQRRATQEAGELAGLHVRRLINEPTAAALYYGQMVDIAQDERVLVYDFGGGTFDVSVLRMGALAEVLSSTGDTNLGGNDLDQRIVVRLLEVIHQREGVDLTQYRPALARLRAAAENARITLSTKAHVRVQEAHIPTPNKKTCTVSMEFTRENLEDLVDDIIERTIASVETALEEAQLRPLDIHKVVLVGGVTRMPAIVERMEDIFGDARMPVIDPDRAVACGAAIQGGLLSGTYCERILVDITPHTLSVEAVSRQYFDDTLGLFCVPIIARNTQIPATRARTFYTASPNQPIAEVNVYQGESWEPEENTLLGQVELQLAKSPAGSPIVVEYSYDANGMVHLKAEQKGYGRKVEIHLDSHKPQSTVLMDVEAQSAFVERVAAPTKQPMNFVLQRAEQILSKISPSEQKTTIENLLHEYKKALATDSDAVDTLEDALINMLDEHYE